MSRGSITLNITRNKAIFTPGSMIFDLSNFIKYKKCTKQDWCANFNYDYINCTKDYINKFKIFIYTILGKF